MRRDVVRATAASAADTQPDTVAGMPERLGIAEVVSKPLALSNYTTTTLTSKLIHTNAYYAS